MVAMVKCNDCRFIEKPSEKSRGLDWCSKFNGSTAWARARPTMGNKTDCGPLGVAFEPSNIKKSPEVK
jgi:hypothetical protein